MVSAVLCALPYTLLRSMPYMPRTTIITVRDARSLPLKPNETERVTFCGGSGQPPGQLWPTVVERFLDGGRAPVSPAALWPMPCGVEDIYSGEGEGPCGATQAEMGVRQCRSQRRAI